MDDADESAVLAMCEDDPQTKRDALFTYLSEHGLPLTRAIRGLLADHGVSANLDEMAEDIFQQVVVELIRAAKSQKLLEVRSLPGYVYGAAKKRALMYLRTGGRRAEMTMAPEDFIEATDRILVDHGMNPRESSGLEDAIYDCIEALAGKKREYIRILTHHDCTPPTPAEIARMLGVSPESVRNRLSDARKNMRECLRHKGFSLPFRTKGSAG